MIESTVNIIQAANIEVGLSTNVDGYLYFDNGETNKPGFRFNSSVSKLQFSHDGNYWVDFTLPIVGGELSGTRGPSGRAPIRSRSGGTPPMRRASSSASTPSTSWAR